MPRFIILSTPPIRHTRAGGCTVEDRPPVAGQVIARKVGGNSSSSAWNFNFNNGNENRNNLDNANNNRAFAVRSRR